MAARLKGGVSVLNMKKLFTSVIAAIGIASSTQAEVTLSLFERTALQAKKTQDYMPVWELFVNTEFFVSVIPLDTGKQTSDFRFSILQGPGTNNEPVVVVSENLERLSIAESGKAIKLRGGKLIQMVNPEVGIVIALIDGAFGIPKEQVQWLKSSIQPAH